MDDPGERSPDASEDPPSRSRTPDVGSGTRGVVAVVARPSTGRRGRTHPDLTTGSVPRRLWSLSWPQWLENVLGVLDQLVDLFWAGRLPSGYQAIAGVGVTQTITQFGNMARQGLDQGLRAMVARAVGAGDIHLANHIAQQAFTLNALYLALVVTVGWLLTDVLLMAIRVSDEVRAQTAMYMRVQFLSMAPMALRGMTGAMLQASGDVMTPLKATTVARVLGVILTPLLMFGWLGFPFYGLMGAALANVVAQGAGAGVNIVALFRGTSRLHLTFRGYHPDFRILGRLLRIGVPASVGGMERGVSQIALLAIVTPFGDIALAGYALTRRVETLANFGAMGVGNATGVMVGQNLGAGRSDRSRQSIGWGLT